MYDLVPAFPPATYSRLDKAGPSQRTHSYAPSLKRAVTTDPIAAAKAEWGAAVRKRARFMASLLANVSEDPPTPATSD